MLNIYYGSETIDKERFLFQQIKGKTLLLVPDQFSLQAERDAFFYLKKKGLMDLRIVDFSALGHKVVNQTGGSHPPLIDKYGRHMLLTKILGQVEPDLKVYKGLNWKNSFIELVNSLISEMKRFEITPNHLQETIERLDGKSFLQYKLEDIHRIYTVYQEAIDGKYLDSEDYISFYGEKILHAPMVAESRVWIYGFDTFTPKNMLVIQRLLKTAEEVNIIMTCEEQQESDRNGILEKDAENLFEDAGFLASEDRSELFSLTRYVISKLRELAEELNEEVTIQEIAPDLYAKKTLWEKKPLPVVLAETSGFYAEAERAADYIWRLVQDEGYRFGDMVVICNDTDVRGGILKRTFSKWGIPVFMDTKRQVLHHPAVSFLLALMEIMAKGYRDEAVVRLIKSGLLFLSSEDGDLLENYVKQYRIRGTMWKKPFTRGGDFYSVEELNAINEMRVQVTEIIEGAKEKLGARNKAGEKIRGLYQFLEEDFSMQQRLEQIMDRQEEMGLAEGAAETAQSWSILCSIFDQIMETVGEERIANEELLKLMTAGFEEMEIGIVPVSSDSVIIGTLQRTRLSRIKVLLAVGVNEGVLPLEGTEEGLLSQWEKATLETLDLEIAKSDDVVKQEERLAIYRIFSLPEERLYVSCSKVNDAGESLRPSGIFERLKSLLQQKEEGIFLGDLEDSWCIGDLLTSREGALLHMTNAFRKYAAGEDLDGAWLQVLDWYEEHDPERLKIIKRGMFFDNRLDALGKRFADDLYRGDLQQLTVSASRLEKYSSCPFAHFVGYGLRPEEPRYFEIGAREIGDVYHQCLMHFSRQLTDSHEGHLRANDPQSPWMTMTREECRKQIRLILQEEMAQYNEGILKAGKAEEYRTERIVDTCSGIAWALVQQVRKGQIQEMYFERPFGKNRALPPISVDVGGSEVMIQGKIDRIDVLQAETGAGEDSEAADSDPRSAVRIIDYKTGANSLDLDQLRSGYQLQLMVYLAATQQKNMGTPAGVFYFKIKDLDTDADVKPIKEGADAFEERLEEAYKLEGIVLHDEGLIQAMDGDIQQESQVLPVKRSKKAGGYTASRGGYLLSDEEFQGLYQQVEQQVQRICREICEGKIEISPAREKKKDMDGNFRNACKYCSYKSICMFDTAFAGCRFRRV